MQVSNLFTLGVLALAPLPALAAPPPAVLTVRTSELASRELSVTLSPHYEVVLQFPARVTLASSSDTTLFKVTVPPPPGDSLLLLSGGRAAGSASLTVIVDGDALLLRVQVDPTAKTGPRKIVVRDDEPANAATSTAAATLPARTTPSASTITASSRPRLTFSAALRRGTLSSELRLTVRHDGGPAVTLAAADLRLSANGREVRAAAPTVTLRSGETRAVTLRLGAEVPPIASVRASWLASTPTSVTLLSASATP